MKGLINPKSYLAVLNGLIGDKLDSTKHPWAISMSFRRNAEDVEIKSLIRELHAKSVLVLVHGLMADEKIWESFAELEKGHAVLHVRYNTGLHISENGQALSNLLRELETRAKPKSILLAGHSMGGLVIRSACHDAAKRRLAWVKKVNTIFLIAVPNAGAALEQLGHVTTTVLQKIQKWYLGTIGDIINARSNGIKDLRTGMMLESDWRSAAKTRSPVPPIPGIHYHILVGNITSNEKTLMAKYFGDGIVSQHSAVAATLLKVSTVTVFPNTGHNSILRSPKVIQYIKDILEGKIPS